MGSVGPTIPSGGQDRGFLGQRCWLRHLLLVVLAVLLAGVASFLGPVSPASADTIVVNTTVDEDDGTVPNRCSLREAITAANTNLPYNGCLRVAAGGDDVIQFNLTDPSPFPSPYRLFMSLGALPPMSDAVTIDGWSQGDSLGVANYHGPPLIWIDSGGTSSAGLTVSAGDVALNGLAITAGQFGVFIVAGGTHSIIGSYLGGLPLIAPLNGTYVSTGTVVQQTQLPGTGIITTGNSQAGIFVFTDLAEELTVGGTDPGSGSVVGNVVVANQNGIEIVMPPMGTPPSLVGVSLYGNFIGTDLVGAAGLGNVSFGLLASDLQTATIGDGTVAGRNVFAGNGGSAVDLTSADFNGTGVSIRGNYIGVKPDGLTALGNNSGILMNGFLGTVIGGPTEFERNVIAGNTNGPGIQLHLAAFTGIFGNYVGVGKDGSTAAANKVGIKIVESTFSDIGGPTVPERNVISGNTEDGIYFEGDCGCPGISTIVRGNHIGVNANGDAKVPNHDNGIQVFHAFGITIGGFNPGDGNVISGNDDHGITIIGEDSEDIEVFGNRIGTNAAGTVALGNGLDGVNAIPDDDVDPELGPEDITIGDDTPGAGNVISGNGRHGVYVSWTFDELLIVHNLIGVNVNGDPLPNAKVGVVVNESPEVIIFENFIANNGRAGILEVPLSGCGCFEPGVLILTNSIYNNQRLGIDITPTLDTVNWEGDGPTPNDSPDVDGVQNFPVIQSTTATAGGAVISGSLVSEPDLTYRVELFATPNCDTPNFGEGRTFLGGIDVVTNGGGVGAFTMTVPTVPSGHVVTSTASHPFQFTSEFSACAPVTTFAPLLTVDPASVTEGTGGTTPISFTVHLTPAGGSAVSVGWQVVNGTATLGHDIVLEDATGVVTFAPGETTKTIVIRIIGDSLPEPTETFTLRVVSPPSPSQEATGTIVDNDVAAGPCSPRPNVVMTTQRTGPDRLVVTVKAGLGTLKKITFASAAEPMLNAQVETIGPSSVIQGFGVYTPQPNVTQQSFVVKRIVPNQPVMVEFVVEDQCGNWQTFIGNGPNPW